MYCKHYRDQTATSKRLSSDCYGFLLLLCDLEIGLQKAHTSTTKEINKQKQPGQQHVDALWIRLFWV